MTQSLLFRGIYLERERERDTHGDGEGSWDILDADMVCAQGSAGANEDSCPYFLEGRKGSSEGQVAGERGRADSSIGTAVRMKIGIVTQPALLGTGGCWGGCTWIERGGEARGDLEREAKRRDCSARALDS